jgi:hypothetical protein
VEQPHDSPLQALAHVEEQAHKEAGSSVGQKVGMCHESCASRAFEVWGKVVC